MDGRKVPPFQDEGPETFQWDPETKVSRENWWETMTHDVCVELEELYGTRWRNDAF